MRDIALITIDEQKLELFIDKFPAIMTIVRSEHVSIDEKIRLLHAIGEDMLNLGTILSAVERK